VLLGDASDTQAVGAVEEQLWRSGCARVELVLVQRNDCAQPAGTMAWLAPRRVHAHHHLRMREDGLVIGSNVTSLEDRDRRYQFGAAVSGWDVLFRAINPFAHQVEAPSLFEMLLRTVDVNIAQRLKSLAFRQLADVLIEPQISRFGMLDFDAYAELIDIGYQEALPHLPAIQAVLRARGGAAC